MNFPLRLFTLTLFTLCISACSTKYEHQLHFDPSEPLRVAVLPFVQIDSRGNIIEEDAELFIDGVPLVSEALEENPSEYVRKLVQNEVEKTSLDLISPLLVNVELPHHGFGNKDGSFDLTKIYSTEASDFCNHFLDCDAVLYGKITDWDRIYLGIQTVNIVSLDLSLVSAKSGEEIFTVTGTKSDGRGISGGPTGFSDLVVEPLRGLDAKIIAGVASDLIRDMMQPLRVGGRPGMVEQTPPVIFAASHDGRERLGRNSVLTVLAYATPGQYVSFSIGNILENIPMEEVVPGHYIGEYLPLASDRFLNQTVSVQITDGFGRTVRKSLEEKKVSL